MDINFYDDRAEEVQFRHRLFLDQRDECFKEETLTGLDGIEQAENMCHIIRFVEKAISDEMPNISLRAGRLNKEPRYTMNIRTEHFLKLLPRLVTTVSLLPEELAFDESIEVFRSCCHDFDFFQDDHLYLSAKPECIGMKYRWGMTFAEVFNKFVQAIRDKANETRFKETRRSRLKELKRGFRNGVHYIDGMFERTARLLVIRLDLGYAEKVAPKVTSSRAQQDIRRLLGNRRENKLFRAMKGQFIKREYGVKRGIHFHVLLFFDGSIRSNTGHIDLATKIGNYWRDVITNGDGWYRNVNANIKEYQRKNICGIGPINAHDVELRYNLTHRVLRYFFKSAQYIRPRDKAGKITRQFRRGILPPLRPVKMGRPRLIRHEQAAILPATQDRIVSQAPAL